MARLTRESMILVGTKDYKIEDLLKTIIYLPASYVNSFFEEIGLTIPRELRIFVLREVLREKVIETRKSRLTLADELNYRLSWFTEFTETQLENLLIFFDDPKIDRDFLEEFWTDLLSYMNEKKVPAKDLKRILDSSLAHVRANGLQLPSMKTFNRDIKNLFFDSYGRIDGLAPAKFRPVLFKSSTLHEIRDLGSKYDVDVPRRLKKTELADIIIHELKDRGQHTEQLETQVRGMSVLIMQRFAIDHDIKASTELKKEEIIEYILANAKETKESYFIPDSPKVYEKEVEEVAKHVEPTPKTEETNVVILDEEEKTEDTSQAVTEEAVVEEPIEEVKTVVQETPKPVQRETQVQYAAAPLDLSELVNEIKLLRKSIEKAVEDNALQMSQETVEQGPRAGSLSEPLVLNSAEFYGNPKILKKLVKNDEIEEREKFIEARKAQSSIGTNKDDDDDDLPPKEAIFIKKLFKFLLKFILITIAVVVVLLVVYSVASYFIPFQFVRDADAWINGLYQIGGKGIVLHIHELITSIIT
ncbi:MAG: hypothetical protein Q7I99_07490 [Acholeplasmataceae bacterium]|nr:hypothetical protein [Acholeplasmataceae bacterium]